MQNLFKSIVKSSYSIIVKKKSYIIVQVNILGQMCLAVLMYVIFMCMIWGVVHDYCALFYGEDMHENAQG